jgi:GxxExxY protein
MDIPNESSFNIGNNSITRVEESLLDDTTIADIGSDQWIISIANKVYSYLGRGYTESVYQRAFEIELRRNNIRYATEVNIPILYEGEQVGIGRADTIIYKDNPIENIILEFKSIAGVIGIKELEQIGHYMRHLGIPTGIIINFPQPVMDRRIPIDKVNYIIGKNQS